MSLVFILDFFKENIKGIYRAPIIEPDAGYFVILISAMAADATHDHPLRYCHSTHTETALEGVIYSLTKSVTNEGESRYPSCLGEARGRQCLGHKRMAGILVNDRSATSTCSLHPHPTSQIGLGLRACSSQLSHDILLNER